MAKVFWINNLFECFTIFGDFIMNLLEYRFYKSIIASTWSVGIGIRDLRLRLRWRAIMATCGVGGTIIKFSIFNCINSFGFKMRASLWNKWILYLTFGSLNPKKSVKMTRFGKSRIGSPIKVGYFLSTLKFLDLNSDLKVETVLTLPITN